MGNDLAVGDFVVMGHREYAGLVFGRIESLNKSKVKVRWGPKREGYDPNAMLKDATNVCKIDGPDATAYCLRKGI